MGIKEVVQNALMNIVFRSAISSFAIADGDDLFQLFYIL
jgi:hypothetical protein